MKNNVRKPRSTRNTMKRSDLNKLIESIVNKKLIKEYFESTRDKWNSIIGALGYGRDMYYFLQDNPGAEEALIEWISTRSEHVEKLKKEYDKEEAEDLGFYDLDYEDEEDDYE